MCIAMGHSTLAEIPWKIAVVRDNIENGFPHTIGDIICLPRGLAVDDCTRTLDDGTSSSSSSSSSCREEKAAERQRHPAAVEALKRVLSVLVHEKIHVYQRMYPEQTRIHVRDVLKRERAFPLADVLNEEDKTRTRSNPDLDGWVYRNTEGPHTDAVSYMVYTTDRPRSLADARIKSVDIGAARPDTGSSNIPNTSSHVYEHPYEEMAYAMSKAIVFGYGSDADVRHVCQCVC